MKLTKLLLIFISVMVTGMLSGQEANRSVIFSEIRNHHDYNSHVEITNMGTTDVNLGEFLIGRQLRCLYTDSTWAWSAGNDARDVRFVLPEVTLGAGESFVIASTSDYRVKMYKLNNRELGIERVTQDGVLEAADMVLHHPTIGGTIPGVTDSVTTDASYQRADIHNVLGWARHGAGLFLQHNFMVGDSAVVDQVLGVFDGAGGANSNAGYSVAGIPGATTGPLLIRKADITTGNTTFVRGISAGDSEWQVYVFPSQEGYGGLDVKEFGFPGYPPATGRMAAWTVGNHGAYVLDANTLESDVATVDFAAKTITVPWGTRRLDGIMKLMVKKPGLVWEYVYNDNVTDSLYNSAQTGDSLKLWVAGAGVPQEAIFSITVAAPTADVNVVVPIAQAAKYGPEEEVGPIRIHTQWGIFDWPRVSENASGVDTISGPWYGIPNALRADTLLAYLEKPANASWEFVMVDGVARPDLKDGDKLKVTSASGSVKEYHIQVQPFEGVSDENRLAYITWPDIPEYLKGIYGWVGDTIPGFNNGVFNYTVEIPFDVASIPALVAKTYNPNATLEVTRATTLSGSLADRTASFLVIAENGDSVTYKVQFEKLKSPDKVQPNFADPFISEYIFKDNTVNNFLEIVNPGNQILDLSNYMFVAPNEKYNPGDAITSADNFTRRYNKYVPGYKWGDSTQYVTQPGILFQDINVNPLVFPGDVFTMAYIWNDSKFTGNYYPWPVIPQLDLIFNNYLSTATGDSYNNPWGEAVMGASGSGWEQFRGSPLTNIGGKEHMYIFKILNDSVQKGLKTCDDPNDFELVDAWGMADGSKWNIAGSTLPKKYNSLKRKPEVFKGNPVLGVSFGTDADNSEWTHVDETMRNYRLATDDIGKHFMLAPTYYSSIVTSTHYIVSNGYKLETIMGVVTGSQVSSTLAKLTKADEGQILKVYATANGAELGGTDVISLNDTLIVLSADGANTTKYVIEVSAEGLSNNALLSSTDYTVTVTAQPTLEAAGVASITGFEYGTSLADAIAKLTVPAGATMTATDASGAYAPMKVLNYKELYVPNMATQNIFLNVVAQNGATTINYQLKPTTTVEDAIIYSTMYTVDEAAMLVKNIPYGTYVSTFFANVIISDGASAILVDNMANERTQGELKDDDKVVVTSKDGSVTRIYYISLMDEYLNTGTYFAYVISNKYIVDQLGYVITVPTTGVAVSDFKANLTPAPGATIVVLNSEGVEKTSGDITATDILRVTSAFGGLIVDYSIQIAVGMLDFDVEQISIYPNPMSGKLYVNGLKPGYKVQVFNIIGGIEQETIVSSSTEMLSLEHLPAGMFIIKVSHNSRTISSFKAIRK